DVLRGRRALREEVAGVHLLAILDAEAGGVLDLVDALFGLFHGDRDLGAVDADLARDRRGHVRLALGAALRLGDRGTRDDLRAVLDRENVARRDRDRNGVVL